MHYRHAVILEGPPLCGKSSQARKLEEKLEYCVVDSGKILREYPGLLDTISNGDLVPDNEVIGAISKNLPRPLPKRVVFSGLPRSVVQGEWLKEVLSFNHCHVSIILFQVREQTLLTRLDTRHKKERRPDDTVDCVKHRLRLYKEYSPEVRRFLCTSDPSWKPHWVDAEFTKEQVSREVVEFTINQLIALNKNRPLFLVRGFQPI